MENINLTIGKLKEIIKDVPDDMDVIIPVIPEDDCNNIIAFRHVRTVGVLENYYEESQAVCLNASSDGLDISSQITKHHRDTSCVKLLF